MRIAVTGASGHAGHSLCRALLQKGYKIKALYHQNLDDLDQQGIQLVKGNILDIDSLKRLCEDVDIVFHLAAKISIDKKQKDLVYAVNVYGTENIIEACISQGVGKLIHFSTIHTLDNSSGNEINEQTSLIRHSGIHYDFTKMEAEKRILKAASNGLHTVVLNPTAIVGPYDHQPSYLGQAMIKMYNNSFPMLVGGGYNFVDSRDVANAALSAMEFAKSGERYILSGTWLSLAELSKKIGELFERKTSRRVAPDRLARMGLPFVRMYAAMQGKHPLYTAESLEILANSARHISNEKAKKELKFSPRPIEESLKDVFDWYKNNNLITT